MNKDLLTAVSAGTIVLCTLIISGFLYNTNVQNNMAKNIDSAIAKGVDPVSVKCAYETSTNAICITYAANLKK